MPLVVTAAVTELVGAAAIFWLVTLLQGSASRHVATPPRWLAWAVPSGSGSSTVAVVLLALGGLFILKNLLLAWTAFAQSRLIAHSMETMFDRLVNGLLRAPYRLHPRRNSSEIVYASFHGIDQAFRLVLGPAISLFAESLVLIGICAVLLWLTPWASVLVALVLGGTTALLLGLLRKPVLRWGRENHIRGQSLIGQVAELLAGQKEIRTMRRESEFHERIVTAFRIWDNAQYRHATAAAMPRLVIETVFILSAIAIFAITRGVTASSGDLVPIAALFAYAGFRVIPGANRIALDIDLIRHGKAAIDKLSELMSTFVVEDEDRAAASVERSRDEGSRGCRVEVDRVSYSYGRGEPLVLENASFRIGAGQSFGIVGATGSGKSTLIDLVAGLLTPDSGSIAIDGVSVQSWQRAGGRIGYVPQVGFLLDDTIENNIAMGSSPVDRDRIADAIEVARLGPFVDALPDGLATVIGERGVRISGGERQRIALARVLYFDPDLLLLDEATSALDYRTEIELGRAMTAQGRPRTTIIVAHRLETLRDCDQIIVVGEGSILARGTSSELERGSDAFRRLLRDEGEGSNGSRSDGRRQMADDR